MQPLLSSSQMRSVDKTTIDSGIPEIILMEHAALALVAALEDRFSTLLNKTTGIILAGAGNNGGDVLAATRMLHEKGVTRLFVVLFGDKLSSACEQQWKILQKQGVTCIKEVSDSVLSSCDWILDGIFGTGLSREVSGVEKAAIEKVNTVAGKKWVISADIPSGLSADNGQVLGTAVKASETVTFGFYKKGLVTGSAADYVGKLSLATIQIPRKLNFTPDAFLYEEASSRLPARARSGHKGSFGKVYIISGDKEGASILAATGALRAGAGLVTLFTDKVSREMPPEIITQPLPEKFSDGVYLIGPGLGLDQKPMLQKILELHAPTVLDADALTILEDGEISVHEKAVLTPHPKEASRLLGCDVEGIEKDRYLSVKKISEKYQCPVLLKGKGTLIAKNGSPTVVVTAGNTSLAKGGTGDLLSGIIAAFLAQGMKSEDALALGAYVHGRAAEILSQKLGTERTALAQDIGFTLADVFKELE